MKARSNNRTASGASSPVRSEPLYPARAAETICGSTVPVWPEELETTWPVAGSI